MKNNVNIAEIMKRAHAAARRWYAMPEYRGKLWYSDILGICLRHQWKRAKLRASLPTLDEARAEIENGRKNELYDRIAPTVGYCLGYELKKQHAETENPGAVEDMIRRAYADIKQETITRIWYNLTTGTGTIRKDGTTRTLYDIIYNAAGAAIMQTKRAIIRHATAASTDANGNTIIDTYATPHALRQTQDPETRAINRDTIAEVIKLISNAYRKDALIILRAELAGYKPADYYKYITRGTLPNGGINYLYIKRVKDAIDRAAFEHPFLFDD